MDIQSTVRGKFVYASRPGDTQIFKFDDGFEYSMIDQCIYHVPLWIAYRINIDARDDRAYEFQSIDPFGTTV